MKNLDPNKYYALFQDGRNDAFRAIINVADISRVLQSNDVYSYWHMQINQSGYIQTSAVKPSKSWDSFEVQAILHCGVLIYAQTEERHIYWNSVIEASNQEATADTIDLNGEMASALYEAYKQIRYLHNILGVETMTGKKVMAEISLILEKAGWKPTINT